MSRTAILLLICALAALNQGPIKVLASPDEETGSGQNGSTPLMRPRSPGVAPTVSRNKRGLFSSSWNAFTDQNHKLLQVLKMENILLVKDQSVRPTTEAIEWSQFSRCWWLCHETYRLVDYYQQGNRERKFKVFVNDATWPPNRFRTSGYRGKLFFGFLPLSKADGAVFFVIHPYSWRPFVHRFKTNRFTRTLNKGLSAMGGMAAGAAIGSIVPGIGTLAGGAIGMAAEHFGGELTEDYFGDHLRFIG